MARYMSIDIALRFAGLLKMSQPMPPSFLAISLSVVVAMRSSGMKSEAFDYVTDSKCNQYNCALRGHEAAINGSGHDADATMGSGYRRTRFPDGCRRICANAAGTARQGRRDGQNFRACARDTGWQRAARSQCRIHRRLEGDARRRYRYGTAQRRNGDARTRQGQRQW